MAPTADADVKDTGQPIDLQRAAGKTGEVDPQGRPIATTQPGETDADAHTRDVKAKAEARRAGLGEKLVPEARKTEANPLAWRPRGLRQSIEMRPYVRGEDLQGIYLQGIHDPTDIGVISPDVKSDFEVDPKNAKSWVLAEDIPTGYIARSESGDQWYLSKAFVDRYYHPAYDVMGRDPTKEDERK